MTMMMLKNFMIALPLFDGLFSLCNSSNLSLGRLLLAISYRFCFRLLIDQWIFHFQWYSHRIGNNSRPTRVGAFEDCVLSHVALRISSGRFRSRTSKTPLKMACYAKYGCATPFWRHFDAVFSVRIFDTDITLCLRSKSACYHDCNLSGQWKRHCCQSREKLPVCRCKIV